MKYRALVKILKAHDFIQIRQEGSHRQFEGFINGKRHMVTVAYSSQNDDIRRKNLASMIRQSGLPKKLFQ